MKKALAILFYSMIVLGITVGMAGRVICTRTNGDYSTLQPEAFVPDVIETVLHHEELHQLYVCYNDANCVNVYSESGEFRWAVATPYIRNSYFELAEDMLVIYGDDEAYTYNCADGSFLGIRNDLDLSWNWKDYPEGSTVAGKFYYDSYQVYRIAASGESETIVARPMWHRIFNFAVGITVSAAGALGLGIMISAKKLRDYLLVRNEVVLKSRKAQTVAGYFRVTSIVQLVYTVINTAGAFAGVVLSIGIIPIGLHFIISSCILHNIMDNIQSSSNEHTVIDFWKVCEIATFVAAFISVIISAAIAG